ncbi:MAG: hypothetical protein K9H64_22325 [Bacteroidales bacterium]|nr:hypothetical protein [Bacteroidales bacterium]MCF8456382.1 hypothetical protein [Bacteroidales bacterium]
MDIAVENKKVNRYFRFMKNWDSKSKRDLIIKLIDSFEDKNENQYDFSACFGAWEDSRNADEIIDDIRSSRINIREIENF